MISFVFHLKVWKGVLEAVGGGMGRPTKGEVSWIDYYERRGSRRD